MSFSLSHPAARRVIALTLWSLALVTGRALPDEAELRITAWTRTGQLQVTNTFTNGVCTVEKAAAIAGPWMPERNVFTTHSETSVSLGPPSDTTFFRAVAVDLTPANAGWSNLVASYSLLSTIAGLGQVDNLNEWQTSYEGAPAATVELSRPHIAMADAAGNIYIADKEAHAIRKILLDGTIVTAAGINLAGNAPDAPTPALAAALSNPNGLWVRADGTVYILDLDNGKVRRLDTNGMVTTLFSDPVSPFFGGVGRGLWVRDDEKLAYVSCGTVVKKWDGTNVTVFSTGYSQASNLTVDPLGRLVVTDRFGHSVYRIDEAGGRTRIAGNGSTFGGGDGQLATETGLNEVRTAWFLPTGAFFVGTHRGSQVWFVDTDGFIHLFLNGSRNDTHAGDGTYFYAPNELRVSELRAITADHEGNLLITETDAGYVRKVEFLRHVAGE